MHKVREALTEVVIIFCVGGLIGAVLASTAPMRPPTQKIITTSVNASRTLCISAPLAYAVVTFLLSE